mmetsp:Transcript_18536/g.27949  ORF Transcript_18536/g.27949 Transcript_18536/m.27949 type:complete len:412 (+) Transcript_18536:633-1868(+)
MAAGTKSTMPSDPHFNHVVCDVFIDEPRIKSALFILGIKTRRPLIKLLKDHNKIRSVKWRNGQTQSEEDLPEEMKEELIQDTMATTSFPDLLGEPHSVAPVRRFASMAQLHQDISSDDSAGHDATHVTLHDYNKTLVDGGANYGFGNSDEMRLLSYASPSRHVGVTGIGGIDIPEVQVGTFAAKIRLDDGRFVLGIFHEYGEIESRNSIHSKIQLQDGGCEVFDDSVLLDGRQCLVHKDGSIIPFDIHQGLPYIRMIYPSDDDLQNLPRITMTSDSPWNPSMYDYSVTDYSVMGHTNDIVQSSTVNSGENGNQRNHLSEILQSPHTMSPMSLLDDSCLNILSSISIRTMLLSIMLSEVVFYLQDVEPNQLSLVPFMEIPLLIGNLISTSMMSFLLELIVTQMMRQLSPTEH